MADARLRFLRRAAASGDLEAQARVLLERVRAGELPRERLELAAYCGHAPAREALDVASRPSWPACGCEGGFREDGPGACISDGPIAHLLPFALGLQRFDPRALPLAAWEAGFRLERYGAQGTTSDQIDFIRAAARELRHETDRHQQQSETRLLMHIRPALIAWALGPNAVEPDGRRA